MSTRNGARRRKGSHRQKRESLPVSPARKAWLEAVRQESWDDGVAEVIAYWKTATPDPLFVYFIEELSEDGAVKIGKAHDPGSRLRELQCGNPRDLSLRAVILAGADTERYLHGVWRDFAYVRGEWFGSGYAEVIIALAVETASRQVEAHRQGESVDAITGHLLEDIWPTRPPTRLADTFTMDWEEEVA